MSLAARIRRLIHGPTDEEISARSQAVGGPAYPIPPMSTRMPTLINDPGHITGVDTTETDTDVCTCGHPGQPRTFHLAPCPLDPEPARKLAAAVIANARENPGYLFASDAPPNPDEPVQWVPLQPPTDTGDDAVPDSETTTHDDDLDLPLTDTSGEPGPAPQPMAATSGVHAIDVADNRPTLATACETCDGTGYIQRTISELLRDTVAMLPAGGGDEVIREFYRRLLAYEKVDPADGTHHRIGYELGSLFPRDLLSAAVGSGAPGALQRDKLLEAILAVSELYGGTDADMDRLDTAIATFGNMHAAFARPDGTVRGATEEEYEVVIDVFLGLLHDGLGNPFTDTHAAAWAEALNYVKIGMLWAAFHSGMHMARYPRRDAHPHG